MPAAPGASPSSGSTTTAISATGSVPVLERLARLDVGVHLADPLVDGGVGHPAGVQQVADPVGQPEAEDLRGLVRERRLRLQRGVVAPAAVEATGVAQRRQAERPDEAGDVGQVGVAPAAGRQRLDLDVLEQRGLDVQVGLRPAVEPDARRHVGTEVRARRGPGSGACNAARTTGRTRRALPRSPGRGPRPGRRRSRSGCCSAGPSTCRGTGRRRRRGARAPPGSGRPGSPGTGSTCRGCASRPSKTDPTAAIARPSARAGGRGAGRPTPGAWSPRARPPARSGRPGARMPTACNASTCCVSRSRSGQPGWRSGRSVS